MADKKTRNIKVCRQPGYDRKLTPEIKLSGQWLKAAGFEIGDLVRVECEDGKLVILLDRQKYTFTQKSGVSVIVWSIAYLYA